MQREGHKKYLIYKFIKLVKLFQVNILKFTFFPHKEVFFYSFGFLSIIKLINYLMLNYKWKIKLDVEKACTFLLSPRLQHTMANFRKYVNITENTWILGKRKGVNKDRKEISHDHEHVLNVRNIYHIHAWKCWNELYCI